MLDGRTTAQGEHRRIRLRVFFLCIYFTWGVFCDLISDNAPFVAPVVQAGWKDVVALIAAEGCSPRARGG